MTQPIPSSTSFALGGSGGGKLHPLATYPVYIVFMGTHWTTDGTYNGPLTSVAQSMINSAQTILNSTYLSGVMQYGSAGSAYYAGSYVDACTPATFSTSDPKFYEANRAITSHPDCPAPAAFASGAGTTDASNAGIFIEVRDNQTGGSYGGSNDYTGPDSNGAAHCPVGSCNNAVLSQPANVIDASITTPVSSTDVNEFSWIISHELAERMSSGTAAQSDQCYSPGANGTGQIADGEPEDKGLTLSLGGTVPVTVYWSVVDQAFIAPGATVPNSDSSIDARTLVKLVPNIGAVSFRQGALSSIQMSDGSVPVGNSIDTNVQAYTADVSANVYDLTAAGQVRHMTGSLSAPSWTAITGSSTVASQIMAPTAAAPCPFYNLVGGGLYMVASNSSGNPQVWQYGGSGSNWTALTGTNTVLPSPNHALATTIATDCNNNVAHGTPSLFMMAEDSNFKTFIWKYNGSGTSWSQITGSNTAVLDMTFVGNTLYMLAENAGGNYQIWAYQGSGSSWADITPSNWQVEQMWVAGETLVAQAQVGQGGPVQLWQFIPSAPGNAAGTQNWTALTGTNTAISLSLAQDGIEFFMLADNGGGDQVFEFQGIGSQTNSTFGWVALTTTSAFQPNVIRLSASDILQMDAFQNGGTEKWFSYGGSPNSWH